MDENPPQKKQIKVAIQFQTRVTLYTSPAR